MEKKIRGKKKIVYFYFRKSLRRLCFKSNFLQVIKEQLSILGLDPIAIDVPALNARVSAFYELISLHKDIIACEEVHMNGICCF